MGYSLSFEVYFSKKKKQPPPQKKNKKNQEIDENLKFSSVKQSIFRFLYGCL